MAPKNYSGLVQLIMMGEFIRQIWVKIQSTLNCLGDSMARCTVFEECFCNVLLIIIVQYEKKLVIKLSMS